MKALLHPARALFAASLLAVFTSPSFADAKTETLQNAHDELAVLKNKYTDTHPRVVEQKQRIAQLQRRLDEQISVARYSAPIIRAQLAVQLNNQAGPERLFSNTLVTQSTQEASMTVGDLTVRLTAISDDQGNITTTLKLIHQASRQVDPLVFNFPSLKTRSGEFATISSGPYTVQVHAILVDPKGISVDFPGGSLAQLLGAISNQSGSVPFNMIASNDALALAVPAFSVRNAGPRDLALALDQLLVGYVVDFPTDKAERDGQPIFTIRASESVRQESSEPKQLPSKATSYPVTQLLQAQIPIDKVIDSINAAWTLDPVNKPDDLKVKYHEATGILLISARDDRALKLVDRMIGSLREQAEYLKYKAAQSSSSTNPAPVAPKP
jgi:hypothetical protein